MKFPNYLISSLAFVGALSLIIMACSADSTSSNNNNTNAVGKYQISTTSNAGGFFVIDTETGVVKTFKQSSGSDSYLLTTTTITQ